ncbi:MAG: DUF222 domain-containing protein [Aeromicrobium sp.]
MVAELVPTPPHAVACLDALEAVIDSMSLDAYADLDPTTLRSVVDRTRRAKARLGAHELAAVRELDASRGGKARTGDELARSFGKDQAEGSRTVRTAKALGGAHKTEEALAAGELAEPQAAIIAGAVSGLGDDVTAEQRDACEEALIAAAKKLPIKDLRQRALRATDAFKPKEEAAHDEDEALKARERRARQRTEMWMHDNGDGTWRFGGRIPDLHAHLFKQALDAYAAPRRRHLTAEQEHEQEGLTYGQRMGRALCSLIEHLPIDQMPRSGGTPATVTVIIDLLDLQKKVGAATLSTGARISNGELRRLACTQGILPMVFGEASVPLEMGRSRRLFTAHQRMCIDRRDLGCVTPGCEKPPGWCEGHHWKDDWANGATTNVDDGALLCSMHHHEAHEQSWSFRLALDGIIEVRRPGGIWKRNHRWRP